jgi:hypothetical protein
MTYLHMQFQPYICMETKVRVETYHTKTRFELDLRNSMMYTYIKFEFNVCYHCRDNERKLKISGFFLSKFKRDNSVKNQLTMTKFKLDLRILMTNLHLYMHSNKSYRAETENFFFFPNSRGITIKNQRTITKFELDLHISMTYLHMHFQPYTYVLITRLISVMNFISTSSTCCTPSTLIR